MGKSLRAIISHPSAADISTHQLPLHIYSWSALHLSISCDPLCEMPLQRGALQRLPDFLRHHRFLLGPVTTRTSSRPRARRRETLITPSTWPRWTDSRSPRVGCLVPTR